MDKNGLLSLWNRYAECRVFASRVIILIGCIIFGALTFFLTMCISVGRADEEHNSSFFGTPFLQLFVNAAVGLMLATTIIGINSINSLDSKKLGMFATLLLSMALLVAISCGSKYLHRKSELDIISESWSREAIKYVWYKPERNNEATEAWDKRQQSDRCCGLNDATDWNKWRPLELDSTLLPKSCCGKIPDGGQCHFDNAYEQGCLATKERKYQSLGHFIFAIVVFVLLAILALSIGEPSDTPVSRVTSDQVSLSQVNNGAHLVRQNLNENVIPSIGAQEMASAPPPSYAVW
uniref:Tetraspanin-11 n=1 Tax=Aceria tosichella TaxID=561515 RepID=A0A6G1S390_9ACAR